MTDAPRPNPGWYPDPELVDTVRYWDGSGWTEHRAPKGSSPESVGGTPAGAAVTQPPSKRQAGSSAQGGRRLSTPWKVLLSICAIVFVAGAALVIKSSMDSNIQSGRELADAMTTDQGEMEAVAEAFGNDLAAPAVEAAPEANGNCGTPSVDIVSELWMGKLTTPEIEGAPSTIIFTDECEVQIPSSGGTYTWEATGDSIVISDAITSCLGIISASGDSISLACEREFMGEVTTYSADLVPAT